MAAKKDTKTLPKKSQFTTFAILGLIIISGLLFYMFLDLSKSHFQLRSEFEKQDMSSASGKEEIKNILYFIEHESRYGKVYEKLVNNLIIKGKSITEGMKPATHIFCGDDKISTVIKFHPAGFFMLWSETEVDPKIIDDPTKAETAYFYIKDKTLTTLIFDEGKTYLEKATNLKTNKFNVIESFTLSNTNFSYDNCSKEILL